MRVLLAGCAAYVAAWVWAALALPSRVPLHFDVGGSPDRWGSRGSALVGFGVLGVLLALLLGLSLVAVRRGRWAWVNVPHKSWWTATPERQQRLRALAGHDLDLLGGATMALVALVILGTVTAARAPEPALPWWFLLALGLYLAGVVAWTVWSYTRRYRPRS